MELITRLYTVLNLFKNYSDKQKGVDAKIIASLLTLLMNA